MIRGGWSASGPRPGAGNASGDAPDAVEATAGEAGPADAASAASPRGDRADHRDHPDGSDGSAGFDGSDGFDGSAGSGRPQRRSSRSSPDPTRPGRSLKSRALGYLSRREYSRAELSRKLMPHTDDADALEALLDSLVRDGWLSDTRFAESVVHRRAARSGANRIVSELKRHAVGEELIEHIGAQLRETELARAQAVWRKKYGELPATAAERARQARFMAARGFSLAVIGKILKGIDDWADE